MNKNKKGNFFDVWGSLLTFFLMIVVFSVLSPKFRTTENIFNIFLQSSPTLLAALGIIFANMVGESDLSIGGIMGLSASLFCGIIASGGSVGVAFAVALGAGVLFGFLNGVLIAGVGLSSFITTIAMMFLTQGLEYAYSGGKSLWVRDHPVTGIVTTMVGPVPLLVIIALVVFIVSYIVLHRTRVGVHVQAVGLSKDAAKYAGIQVRSIKMVMFTLAGLLYSVAGILNALRSAGSIVYSGKRMLLPAMAVTFVAKTVLGTKRPNIPGVLVGTLMLCVVDIAFTLLGLEFFYSDIASGVILIFAAALAVSDRKVLLQEDLS